MRDSQPNPKSAQSQISSRIVIDGQFLLRRLIAKKTAFNVYECVDLKASRLVLAYVKPAAVDFDFSKRIKQELRSQIAPAVLWSGLFKIEKTAYKVEVHEKLGPSLKAMFSYVREEISERDFLLLLFQLIKLVERFGSVGYVHRELNLENIVFDPAPAKNDLYLLNAFPLRKRGDEAEPIQTKFCSRGAHLGLKACNKDDLESICYIMMSIHTQGHFLHGIASEEYPDAKANIDFSAFYRPLPTLFIDFYSYVVSLNHTDEVNFFRWRTSICKLIGRDTLMKPYAWMLAKREQEESSSEESKENEAEIDIIELEEEIRPEDKQLFERLHHEITKCKIK